MKRKKQFARLTNILRAQFVLDRVWWERNRSHNTNRKFSSPISNDSQMIYFRLLFYRFGHLLLVRKKTMDNFSCLNCAAVSLSCTSRTLAMAFFYLFTVVCCDYFCGCCCYVKVFNSPELWMCVWSLRRHGVCSRCVWACLTRWMSNRRRLPRNVNRINSPFSVPLRSTRCELLTYDLHNEQNDKFKLKLTMNRFFFAQCDRRFFFVDFWFELDFFHEYWIFSSRISNNRIFFRLESFDMEWFQQRISRKGNTGEEKLSLFYSVLVALDMNSQLTEF